VKNSAETDVDCGGACPACWDGAKCLKGTDCKSDVCKNKLCAKPGCTDKVKNGSETDADCGGWTCAACAKRVIHLGLLLLGNPTTTTPNGLKPVVALVHMHFMGKTWLVVFPMRSPVFRKPTGGRIDQLAFSFWKPGWVLGATTGVSEIHFHRFSDPPTGGVLAIRLRQTRSTRLGWKSVLKHLCGAFWMSICH